MKQKHTRIFTIKEQLRNIIMGTRSFVLLRYSKKYKLMNKKLKERIMLAITEVNGCAMCSYVHTKIALSSGMSSTEINEILGGNTKNIPVQDSVATMFAQEFAYSKEVPSITSVERLEHEYGSQKAELIIAACNMITMTNGMGISMDHLYNRIKWNRNKDSNILNEIVNPLLTMVLFPILVLFFGITCFIKRGPIQLHQRYSN